MARTDAVPLPSPHARKAFIKLLEQATPSMRHVGQTFHDWVHLCTFVRRRAERAAALGVHAQRACTICETDEAEYRRLMQPYGRERAQFLGEALGCAMQASQCGEAIMGDVYEELAQSRGAQELFGQFFTPNSLCECIARMVGAGDIGARVSAQLDEACEMAGVYRAERDDETLWLETGARLKPHFKPLSVLDPACGAGNLLHGFAVLVPPWMRASGMVWFYGIDLDTVCAEMCALQLWMDGCAYRVYHGDGLGTRLVSTVVIGADEPIPTLRAETLAQFDIVLANPPFGKQVRAERLMQGELI